MESHQCKASSVSFTALQSPQSFSAASKFSLLVIQNELISTHFLGNAIKIETMKLSDFILLDEMEKKQTVLHEGVLVAKRNKLNYLVFLFQLQSYYVEAYCNIENKAIEEYRAFDNMEPLNPYLELIHIEDLLN
jgi:hypothetical protein